MKTKTLILGGLGVAALAALLAWAFAPRPLDVEAAQVKGDKQAEKEMTVFARRLERSLGA